MQICINVKALTILDFSRYMRAFVIRNCQKRRYDAERHELKTKIVDINEKTAGLAEAEQNKESFLSAIRKFMGMETLTAPPLQELIDHIDIYEMEGMDKGRTQRIVIYYRFVGYVELPKEAYEENYVADTLNGVAVEYIPKAIYKPA